MNQAHETGPPSGAPFDDIMHRVRLSPAHRRIARFLTEHPESAGYLSVTEVASRSGVSQPSVSRFATHLGFASYTDLREALRERVAPSEAPHEPPAVTESQVSVGVEIDNLNRLREQLADETSLLRAAHYLSQTRPLPVLGLRLSHSLASLFSYLGRKFLPDVRLLGTGGSTLLDDLHLARLDGATALFAIALPRTPRELPAALRAARESGLRIVLLVTDPFDPLTELADAVLVAPTSERLSFDSQVAPNTVIMLLLERLFEQGLPDTQHRLELGEDFAQHTAHYLNEA